MLLSTVRALVVTTLCVASLTGPLPGQGRRTAGSRSGGALVVPIKGEVQPVMVALVRRCLNEARGQGASRVILEIDTPGGLVTSMDQVVTLLRMLRSERVDTVAWITREGLSAGAVIALACKRIFMADGATIGAATPVWIGGVPMSDEQRAKYISAARKNVRTIAEHHGPDVALLAEAMVDREVVLVRVRYKGEDGVQQTKIVEDQSLLALRRQQGVKVIEESPLTVRPLTLSAREALALEVPLVEGRADSLEELLSQLGIGEDEVRRMTPTWSEGLAAFLYRLRLVLLVGGVVIGVIALKVPGTGVPEALALLCFILFFAGTWLSGLVEITEILLFVAGIALVLVELFVIPGTFIAGGVGFLLVVGSLFFALQPFYVPETVMEGNFMTDNLTNLLIVILTIIAVSVVLSRFLPHLPFFRHLVLNSAGPQGAFSTAATSESTLSALLGRRVLAATDLRPAGRIEIDGAVVDVVALGFVEKGALIEVVKVEGNRVIVDECARPGDSESGAVWVGWLVLMAFIGLLVAVAEVFFPSFGVLSVIAAVMTISSVFLAFGHGTTTGMLFFVGVGVALPTVVIMAFRILPRTAVGKQLLLAGPTFQPSGKDVRDADLDDFVGMAGLAATTLRPSGTIEIDGRKLDAMTRGEIIDPGTPVRVLQVELAQLVVTTVTTDTD